MAGRGRGRGQLTFNAELLGFGRGGEAAPQVEIKNMQLVFELCTLPLGILHKYHFSLFFSPCSCRHPSSQYGLNGSRLLSTTPSKTTF